jgi:hypothetical protein
MLFLITGTIENGFTSHSMMLRAFGPLLIPVAVQALFGSPLYWLDAVCRRESLPSSGMQNEVRKAFAGPRSILQNELPREIA